MGNSCQAQTMEKALTMDEEMLLQYRSEQSNTQHLGDVDIDLSSLPNDYRRVIQKAMFSDAILPRGESYCKCRCVFIQYKGDVPLSGITISTTSGTIWENVLYPYEAKRPQGIAHLVEHLLYSKAPGDPIDIRQWFADRNGDSNACTTDTDMRLWFTIPPRFLEMALQTMIKSMVSRVEYSDKKELEREMLSVDEEYNGMCDQYEVRVMSILKKLAKPTNPWFNSFTCGNSNTLSEKVHPDIRKRCMQFHNEILKQMTMNIVVVSNHSPQDMINFTKRICLHAKMGQHPPFHQIPLKQSPPPAFSQGDNLPVLLLCECGEWKIEYRIVLPEFDDPMRMQTVLSFISHMFRQQKEGALLKVLHERGLAYGVSGCRSYGGFGQNFFDVEFLMNDLHEEDGFPRQSGALLLRMTRRIGSALFTYLRLLSDEFSKDPLNFSSWVEFLRIKQFQYVTAAAPGALQLANEIGTRMSTVMRKVVPEALAEVITEPLVRSDGDAMAAALRELVDVHLTIDNSIIVISGGGMKEKQWPGWLQCVGSYLHRHGQPEKKLSWESDQWFGSRFCVCKVPPNIRDYCILAKEKPQGTDYKLLTRRKSYAGELLTESFVVQSQNEYVPDMSDLQLRRLESIFVKDTGKEKAKGKPSVEGQEIFELITPSKTMVRVGDQQLPNRTQLFLHRHLADVSSTVQVTTRFFLPSLQPDQADVQTLQRQGTLVDMGDAYENSNWLTKFMLGRILLRCLAGRLRQVSNEAAVAGIQFNVSLTSPMNEGQVALELAVSGYSGKQTSGLFATVFKELLGTTEQDMGDVEQAFLEVKQTAELNISQSQADARTQLGPNMGLILIPISVPSQSQLKILNAIKDVRAMLGLHNQTWTAARLFERCTIMMAIGGNVSVDEAIDDWMKQGIILPLLDRGVDMATYDTIVESTVGPDNIERLPFHCAVLDLDNATDLLPYLQDDDGYIRVYPSPLGKKPTTFFYLYDSHDSGSIVQVSLNAKVDVDSMGMILVLLKAVEQEYFSYIRDVNNLAYYLSVSFKPVGLDISLVSFAVCSATASLEQLLTCSMRIIDAPRSAAARKRYDDKFNVLGSLSGIWTDEEAFISLRDSVVHMLRDDAEVEQVGTRHRVLIGGLFSGAYDFDSSLEVASKLQSQTHEDMIRFTDELLNERSRLVQMCCDEKAAQRLRCSNMEYWKGVPLKGSPDSSQFKLVSECQVIDGGRRWVQLSDPRAIHKLIASSEVAIEAGKHRNSGNIEFERKPRAYRRGTVAVERGEAPRTYNAAK